jgi:hypothetical protein
MMQRPDRLADECANLDPICAPSPFHPGTVTSRYFGRGGSNSHRLCSSPGDSPIAPQLAYRAPFAARRRRPDSAQRLVIVAARHRVTFSNDRLLATIDIGQPR